MIDVCCALILKDSKILIVQRGPESSHPFNWEFPGGKIQPNESAQQCIHREIEEELTLRIDIVTELEPIEFDYGFRQVKLIPFVCRMVQEEIKLTEHIAKRWLKYEELTLPDWSAADRELIRKNQNSLKQLLLKADS